MSAPFRIKRPGTGVNSLSEAESNEKFKSYLDRLVKMIPAEIVTLYLFTWDRAITTTMEKGRYDLTNFHSTFGLDDNVCYAGGNLPFRVTKLPDIPHLTIADQYSTLTATA